MYAVNGEVTGSQLSPSSQLFHHQYGLVFEMTMWFLLTITDTPVSNIDCSPMWLGWKALLGSFVEKLESVIFCHSLTMGKVTLYFCVSISRMSGSNCSHSFEWQESFFVGCKFLLSVDTIIMDPILKSDSKHWCIVNHHGAFYFFLAKSRTLRIRNS